MAAGWRIASCATSTVRLRRVHPRSGRRARADVLAAPAHAVGGSPYRFSRVDSRRPVCDLQLAGAADHVSVAGRRRRKPSRQNEWRSPGSGAAMPATALSKDRLAFVRIVVDTDVYRFRPGRPSEPVVASSFLEAETRFSPDGRRLAFASMRSATRSESGWPPPTARARSSSPMGPGFEQGSPWWSPDGRRIAFDSMTDDWHSHIWTMDADGGTPHRLTTDPGDQNVPYWSRDGRWIYFSADRGAGRDIWRVPATGGPSQPVTRGGSGDFACESADGKSLLYQPKDADSPLLALPLTGGAARQLVACVKPTAFAAGPDGVYYVRM